MTTLEFLEATANRLPTAAEMVDLIEGLGGKVSMGKDGPVLRVRNKDDRAFQLVVALIKREPWRTQVIELAGFQKLPSARSATSEQEPDTWVPKSAFGTDAQIAAYQAGLERWRRGFAA